MPGAAGYTWLAMERKDEKRLPGREADDRPPARGPYGQRPSRCHDEVLRKEMARIEAMTVRERMIEALSLGEDDLPGVPAAEGDTGSRS